jgi:hypothetical protein
VTGIRAAAESNMTKQRPAVIFSRLAIMLSGMEIPTVLNGIVPAQS